MTAELAGGRDQPRRDAKLGATTRCQASRVPDAFVIDDEDGICRFVSMTLGTLGLVPESFHTADEAIAALQRGQPQIVFLDIALGRSDAIDVIRALAMQRYSGVVQLMSGSKSSLLNDVHRIGFFHGLNMRPPLEKPFRKEAIRQAVATISHYDQRQITVSIAPPLEPGLEIALANGWLELWYQPKIDLRTKLLAGAEGVINYRHPIHGVHSADSLLRQASAKTRVALAEHFVVTALRDWDELNRAGVNVRTAVNASFDVLTNLDLASLVRQHRPMSDKWPGLILTVSEHEVIADFTLAHEIATQLRIYDITLAINNFGAGLSSFERLRDLPFSELNLHAGLVARCAKDARNAAMCRAAIDLAHHFEAVAVANGLDNAPDLRTLQNMGCDIAQGALLADPMPRSQFIAALHERARLDQIWFG